MAELRRPTVKSLKEIVSIPLKKGTSGYIQGSADRAGMTSADHIMT